MRLANPIPTYREPHPTLGGEYFASTLDIILLDWYINTAVLTINQWTTNITLVMKCYSSNTKDRAVELRLRGFSLGEIAKTLSIAKSTASLWLKSVELGQQAKEILEAKRLGARQKALESNRLRREHIYNQLLDKAKTELTQVDLTDPAICKLLCAFLYWAEGNKTGYRFAFTNSDPQMIKTFLMLLRRAFILDEKKFSALVHVHEYHNEIKIKEFWSNITGIPLSQFTKSYLKPHTKIIVRQGYPGTVRVAYYDSRIVNELKCIYNMIGQQP